MERVLRGFQESLESQAILHSKNNLDAFNFGFFSVIMIVAAIGVYYNKELGIIREKFENYNDLV
jgi:hypothetical protein